jgi:hypothetical protein
MIRFSIMASRQRQMGQLIRSRHPSVGGVFDTSITLPLGLQPMALARSMSYVYRYLDCSNRALSQRDFPLQEEMSAAALTGNISHLLELAVAKHAPGWVRNTYHNGYPDLLPKGRYLNDSVKEAFDGVEVKATGREKAAPDLHGARPGHYLIFQYRLEDEMRSDMQTRVRFTRIFLPHLELVDFRTNTRGKLGTRTASPNKQGLAKQREACVYRFEN